MAETQSAPSYGAGYPAGAIHNGRESLRRLAAHHAFESAGTPLAMCADYDEAVRCFEFIVSALAMAGATQELRVVFDGPPGINGGRFVEVEDASGHSVRAGEWHARPDGYHELRIVAPTTPTTQSEAVASARSEGVREGLERAPGMEGRFWLELREPRRVPERKGSWPRADIAKVLREFMAARPQAYITVVTMGPDGPHFDDGPETLQMADARSMSTGRQHITRVRAAHGSHEDIATLTPGGRTDG